jgi:hypothetical protein
MVLFHVAAGADEGARLLRGGVLVRLRQVRAVFSLPQLPQVLLPLGAGIFRGVLVGRDIEDEVVKPCSKGKIRIVR